MTSTIPTESAPTDAPPRDHDRALPWIGGLAGTAMATLDAFGAAAVGVHFEIGGADVTLAIWLYLVVSLGGLGWVVGLLVQMRRRERAQAAALAAAHGRLARNETLAALGQFASTVAHEVRNPLAIIRSTVQEARDDAGHDPAAVREGCALALDEIDRLDRVIDGVLDLARPLTVDARPVPVEGLLRQVGALGDRLLSDRGCSLRTEAVADAVQADPDLVAQALLSLVANAAAVTPPGGLIRLTAARAGDRVTLAVLDQGPGVPAEQRGRIFEPFFTTRTEGTGLGLAVVRHIAKAHGGGVEVGDAPGGGARFDLSLPRAVEVAA